MKFRLRTLLIFVACIAGICGVTRIWWVSWGKGQLQRMEASLLALDEVESVTAWGFWDAPFLDFKVVEVDIQLRDKGRIMIFDPSTDLKASFEIWQIGKYVIHKAAIAEGDYISFDFGETGELTSAMPVEFASVEAIIENYDRVLENLDDWPRSRSDALEVVSARQNQYLLWVEINPSN